MSDNNQSPTQDDRPIAISTPLGKDVLLLQSFRFQESLARPFCMELKLQSTNPNIDFNSIVGQNVTVQAITANKQLRYFNGFISSFSQTGFEEGDGGTFANYRAMMVPWLWMLSRQSNCRVFQNQTVPEIVEAVFKDYGISEVQNTLTTQYPSLPYCVQYDETDLDFVNRLMEWQGIYYFFTHTDSTNTLVLCDANTIPDSFPGYPTIYYNPQTHGAHMAEHIYEWIQEQEVQSGSFTLDDYNYTQPKLDLTTTAKTTNAYGNGSYARYNYPGGYSDAPDGLQLATARINALAAAANTRRGMSNTLGLSPGFQFGFEAYPRSDQNTSYLTTSIDLEVITASFATGEDSPIYAVKCDFQAVVATTKYCPPLRTPRPVVRGPQTATVITSNGSLAAPDSYGNVLVQFHWGDSGSNTSCYVRVSQNSAGSNWGSMWIPHAGTEVIVDFEDGDPDRPIITGRVYNANCMPKPDPQINPLLSYFKDSSTINLLEMEATTNAEKLLIRNGKNKILMNSTPGADGIIITDGKSKIIFDTPADTLRLHIDKHKHEHIFGDSISNIIGASVTNVGGETWELFALSYNATFLGLYTELFIGAHISTILGLKFDFFRGLDVNKWWAGRAKKSPVEIEMVDLSAGKYDELTQVCATDTHTVTGAYTIAAGTLDQTVESEHTMQAASSSEAIAGEKVFTVSGFTAIADADIDLSATGTTTIMGDSIMLMGTVIEIG